MYRYTWSGGAICYTLNGSWLLTQNISGHWYKCSISGPHMVIGNGADPYLLKVYYRDDGSPISHDLWKYGASIPLPITTLKIEYDGEYLITRDSGNPSSSTPDIIRVFRRDFKY